MRIDAPPRRRPVTGLTSLIDVIFLLLMFFMLATTFLDYSALRVSAAGAGQGNGEGPDILIRVHGGGSVDVNGRPVGLAGLGAELDAMADRGLDTALLIPVAEATVQDIARVLALARRTRLASVVIGR